MLLVGSPGDLPPQLGTGRESSAADEASSSNGSEASSSDVVQIDLELPRRSMQVSFTCNICSKLQITIWGLQWLAPLLALSLTLAAMHDAHLLFFTPALADGRTERLVNPVAWERGMVIAQCAHCEAWHKLADAANLVQEIRYADLENSDDE